LQYLLEGFRARGVGVERELLERRLRLLGAARAGTRADEQRALPDDLEVDLGRGEAAALASGAVAVRA
jgi:hypothetical protein